jgi:mycothiol synthase
MDRSTTRPWHGSSLVGVWHLETRRRLDGRELEAIDHLVTHAAAHDGYDSLSDHLWLELMTSRGQGVHAVLANDHGGDLVGYAQLAPANESTAIELVVAPQVGEQSTALRSALLDAALGMVAEDGGGAVNWWVHHPEPSADAIAANAGLTLGRRLLQMRCELPITDGPAAETRAFEVGRDEQEWLRVNNAAFHDHPEQGGWTIDTLHQREAEPWFDPKGFRLHERDGRLAAFCWTKVHADTTPPMGEIYVIAVDPEFHGLGLGRALTMAGLAHLASVGLDVGMLHVDAANEAAMHLYTSLGFTVHHADHAYVGVVTEKAA